MTALVDGPSFLLGQLLFRPWSEVYRLARLASSLLAYGVHLCFILGRWPLRYPVPIALNHVQVDNRGASTSQHGLTSAVALRHGWHFRRQEVRRPATAPPGPLGAGGVGTEVQGLVVGRFSQQHLSYWQEQTTDPWIVSTLSNGYTLQFQRRPPTYSIYQKVD